MSGTYPTYSQWVLWWHSVTDEDWTLASFKKLAVIDSIKAYWEMVNTIEDITAGMFYLMREGVAPMWEDPHNVDGGYWSFRVQKSHANSIWKDLVAVLVGESLTVDHEDMAYMNGISFSPKLSNAIFRIWLSDASKNGIQIIDEVEGINMKEAKFGRYVGIKS